MGSVRLPARKFAASLVLTAAVLWGSIPAVGAAASDAGASAFGPGVKVSRQAETGTVGFVGTRPGAAIDVGLPASASPAEVAKAFVASHAKSFGVEGAGASLEVSRVNRAARKGTAVHLQQLQDGLPVLGGELVVDLNARDEVLSVLGETSPSPDASRAGIVSRDEAIAAAIGTVAKDKGVAAGGLAASVPGLQVYDPRLLSAPGPLRRARTAWVLEVTGNDGSEPIRQLAVVDAQLGIVALHFDQIDTALNRSVCDAANTSAKYPCTAPFARIEGQGPTGNSDVDHAYDYAGDTYGFYHSRFGRDSLNGAGLPLFSTVRYCDPYYPCPYENAFWDGSQMVYGEGFAAADDVVGHELSHGFTEFTSHLFYWFQSGAINESMSDVFGEYIDLTNGAGTDTPAVRWLLGEDIPGIGAIRSMKNPPEFGNPDRMRSPLYEADVDQYDNGGVHTNSGVNNKAAYLMADGETFNGTTVTGIGIDKAARVYYETETTQLTSGSDYRDLYNALQQACTNSIGGAEGITAADCLQVTNAVNATEMNQQPLNGPAPEAPVCGAGQSPANLFFDNLENTASGNWSHSALSGAEDGWYYPQNPNAYSFDATYATSGKTNFWGDDPETTGDYAIARTAGVAIPAGTTYLRFNHSYAFEDGEGNGTRYDGGKIEYSTNGGTTWLDAGPLITDNGYNGAITSGYGNPLGGQSAFTAESNGYISTRVNLSSLAGQNVRFRFRIGSDSSFGDYGWFIDDVRVYSCGAPPPPPPTEAPPVSPAPLVSGTTPPPTVSPACLKAKRALKKAKKQLKAAKTPAQKTKAKAAVRKAKKRVGKYC